MTFPHFLLLLLLFFLLSSLPSAESDTRLFI